MGTGDFAVRIPEIEAFRPTATRAAGRAVAWLSMGRTLRFVTIVPNAAHEWQVCQCECSKHFTPHIPNTLPTDMRLGGEIECITVSAYAGEIALARHHYWKPISISQCASIDEHKAAHDLCSKLFADPIAESYLQSLYQWSDTIVTDEWVAVECIANRLLIEKTITGLRLKHLYIDAREEDASE